MFIYKITNLINGKIYIGQTITSVGKRWNCHCRTKGTYGALNAAICKYGKDNFKVETIEICSSLEELNLREQYWIAFYNSISPNGYNIELGGGNKVPSLETRLKQSKAKLGKKYGKRHSGAGNNISLGNGAKQFSVFTKDGKFVGNWVNKSQCARDLNLLIEKISACCNGKRKSHKNYIFKYTEENDGK